MVKRLTLQAHPHTDELERHYREARDPVARSQWQILWLLARGEATAAVAAATGYSPTWIYQIVRRYNADGPGGVGDRRHRNPGAAPLLDAAGQADLRAAPRGAGSASAARSDPAVASWLAGRLGRPVGAQRGRQYLRRLGHTPQVPRPAHAQADPAAQGAFKRGASPTP
jgi:transposase